MFNNEVEDILANVDADRGQRCGCHGLLLRMLRGSVCRLSRWAKQLVPPISGHGAMSDLSPLSGAKRKLHFGAVRAAFDPEADFAAQRNRNGARDLRGNQLGQAHVSKALGFQVA